jgi:hypothetical protein
MELAGLEPATSWVRSVYGSLQHVAAGCSSARMDCGRRDSLQLAVGARRLLLTPALTRERRQASWY